MATMLCIMDIGDIGGNCYIAFLILVNDYGHVRGRVGMVENLAL